MKIKQTANPGNRFSTFNIIVVFLLVVTFVISVVALNNTIELKKSLPQTVDVNQFLAKLTSHEEMAAFVGISPLNIIQVNQQNLANLQAQIAGLDASYIGDHIIQYQEAIVIYNFDADTIKGQVQFTQPTNQLPGDFFQKLGAHSEAQGLENEQPVGGQLDQQTLLTLQQQFPQIYNQAKAGDFLLRYQTRLIVYDYAADEIVVAVSLQ